ncbi:TFIIH complex subunit TFB6 SCDLUD_003365 [Saccharomycodes ludwigii]|uniref:TFIIH complex subunit TFB6 n=1 Tax=Saccharomycodes ludwigii TaxID=36035 RepID=UPI001E832DD1|nr:hypothetical protein SCDLUD_003365 [Saccharomycodes ludwigii]KAH3900388.1 hypothetical protein SCDLUD_003365 [Saccharomycodes ludwigii]
MDNIYNEKPATPRAESGVATPELPELDSKDLMDLDIDDEPTTQEKNSQLQYDAMNTSPQETDDAQQQNDKFYDHVDTFKPNLSFNNLDKSLSYHTDITYDTSRRLSASQETKFLAYCEEQLMKIQRKYVQSRGLNPENGYTGIVPLLKDLKRIIDFVWYSIDNNCKNTEDLLSLDSTSNSSGDDNYNNELIVGKAQNMGQCNILLKIADDLIDYVGKFPITDDDIDSIKYIFMIFFIMDKVLSFTIINESRTTHDNNICSGAFMNTTELIRCTSICERSRVQLFQFFQDCKIHGYHYELSKIYEETLDKS